MAPTNPPMEKWMKEQAAKFHGGLCMSKFVQQAERKRLARLQTVRSTVAKQGLNYNPRQRTTKVALTANQHKDPKDVKDVHIAYRDYILSEQTRTGLTLRLQSFDKSQHKEQQETHGDKHDTGPTYERRASQRKSQSNKEKENEERSYYKDSNFTRAVPKDIHKPSPSDPTLTHPTSIRRRNIQGVSNPCLVGTRTNVSISDLTREREEALALLKTLCDEDPFKVNRDNTLAETIVKLESGGSNEQEALENEMDIETLYHHDPSSSNPNHIHYADSFFR